jgi:hypothetical protein
MRDLDRFIPFFRIIIFSLGIGLGVLAFEIYLQHYEVLSDKKITWTPVVFGSVGGIVLIFVSLFFNRFSLIFFALCMIISCLVGLLGLYLHNIWRFKSFKELIFNAKPLDMGVLTSFTPLLAPSAFCAIGMLGLLLFIYMKILEGNN